MSTLSFMDATVGARYEAFIPSESVLLSQGVDIRDFGVRLATSIRAANLLILTDSENTSSFASFLEVVHDQMSRPSRILYFGSDSKQWLGGLQPDARLSLRQLSAEAIVGALRQPDDPAEPGPQAGHDMASMKHHPKTEHDMAAMDTSLHAAHKMPDTTSELHAGHDMTSMDHSAHDGNSMPGMDHSAHGGHDAGSFMSMVAMTEGQFRSRDGLIMEPGEVIFGPFHPALTPGWRLKLVLDGDTVQIASISRLKTGTVPWAQTFDGDTYDTLAWLLRLGTVLGWQHFAESVRRALLMLSDSSEPAQLQHQLAQLAKLVHRNPVVRNRLIGLGVYREKDAWERLVGAVDGLITKNPAIGSSSSAEDALPKILIGLEVGDALVVAASFYMGGTN